MSNKKKLFIVLGVLIIIAIFVIINLRKGTSGQIEVQVEKVTRGNIIQTISGSGKIRPEVEVKISANVSAEIIRLNVKEGDKVKKGDLLVQLDSEKYQAVQERAKSTLKSAEANLKKAKSDYNRTIDLFNRNLVSLAEKETVEASLMLAESEVEQARANLAQTSDELSKTRIFSPMDGTVSQLNKELGEIALGSTFQADVIMVVADLSNMEVVAEIDENDVVLVTPGDTANIEVDALPDTVFKGIVSEIAHTATTRGYGTQEEVTNFEVKIAVLDMVQQLRPGMSATVDIKTNERTGILHIPIQAVTVRMPDEIASSDEKSTDKSKPESDTEEAGSVSKPGTDETASIEIVFLVEGENVRILPVKTGISNDTDIEIIDGPQEGQQVVTGSYRAISKLLKNGSRIKIAEKTTKFKSKEDKEDEQND